MKGKQSSRNVVGIIGAGSFGTAIANLVAVNNPVLLFSRNKELVDQINDSHRHLNQDLNSNIKATNDLSHVGKSCKLIFPVVPSESFRAMMKALSPHVSPAHILIHGTKGFDIVKDLSQTDELGLKDVYTMSEVIVQESSVVRIGCLSGPNLSKEIMEGQPTATLVASHFSEVVKIGQRVLNSNRFHVFGSSELLGAELAGALKNAIALGSGLLGGKGLGKNIQAMLITRGLNEMVRIGEALGASSKAFIGTAGIGDLIATSTSKDSRNYTFGYHFAQGKSIEDIKKSMPELAEGVRTIKVMKCLGDTLGLRLPITAMLYEVVYNGFSFDKAMEYLMEFPYNVDVDFI